MTMRRKVLAVGLMLGLAGCGGGAQMAPPGMPTIPAVTAQTQSLSAISDPAAFYTNGALIARIGCNGFFDQAVMADLQRQQQLGAMNLGSGALLGLLGLSGVGGVPIAAIGTTTAALNQLSLQQAATTLAGSDPAATAALVQAAQEKLMAAEPMPTSGAQAYSEVYDVYQPCSPTGIQQLKEQAIAAAPNHLVVSAPAGLPTAAIAPRPVVPMSVRVQ